MKEAQPGDLSFNCSQRVNKTNQTKRNMRTKEETYGQREHSFSQNGTKSKTKRF